MSTSNIQSGALDFASKIEDHNKTKTDSSSFHNAIKELLNTKHEHNHGPALEEPKLLPHPQVIEEPKLLPHPSMLQEPEPLPHPPILQEPEPLPHPPILQEPEPKPAPKGEDIKGGDTNDIIDVFGKEGSVNSINAGAGEDTVTTGDKGTYNITDTTGSGNDTYILGKGIDNLIFDAVLNGEGISNGNDIIENFDTIKDTIELKGLTSQGRNNVTYKQEDNGDVTITYAGDTITVKDANVDEVRNSVIFS